MKTTGLKGKTIKQAKFGGYAEWLDVEFTDGTKIRLSPFKSTDMFSPITCISIRELKK